MQSDTGSSQVGQYVPPKMWKELTVDEKLERIRSEIKHTQQLNGSTRMMIENLRNDFQNHGHLNGNVVKDIKTYNISEFGYGAKLDNLKAEEEGEVYF